MKKIAVYVALFAISLRVFAAECVPNQSFDSSKFLLNPDGTVTDLTTELVWSRCAFGQSWDSGKCVGEPTQLNWLDAHLAARDFVLGGRGDWRVPNIKELNSIVDIACSPALNTNIFGKISDTNKLNFWTSTIVTTDDREAYGIQFDSARDYSFVKVMPISVRFVRGGS